MQQPQITMTRNLLTPTREQLLGMGLVEEVAEVVSPQSGIKYRFTRIASPDRGFVFAPLFLEGPNYTVIRLYVRINDAPGQVPAAEKLISGENADLGLAKFPGPQHVQNWPGFKELFDRQYFIIAPNWCIAGLAILEDSNSKGTRTSTIIIPESLTVPTGVLQRPFSMIPSIGPLDATLAEKLSMTLVQNKGTPTETKTPIPGINILQDPSSQGFVQQKEIKPRADARTLLIGRPYCLDILSEFVVADQVIVGPAPTGFLPPPQTNLAQPQPMAPAGFQQPPATVVVAPQQPLQRVPLTAEIQARLDTFLKSESCRGVMESRMNSLVRKLLKESAANFQGYQGKYLNVSTCQIGDAKGKHIRRTIGTVPGTQQPFNLALKMETIARIITGNTAEVIPDNNIYINEIFFQIAGVLSDGLGSALSNIPENVGAIPTSILDTLPAGPKPAQRPQIMAKSPFVNVVPLPGITDVTTPITEGKRCLPGLMAKKRD